MTATQQAQRDIALLTEQVTRQIEALVYRLQATMTRAQYGERCIVVVGGNRYY